MVEIKQIGFSSHLVFFLSSVYSFGRNASIMYSKDTAPSNEEQRRSCCGWEGGRLFTERTGWGLRVSQRSSNQSGIKSLNFSQVSVINHIQVTTCQISLSPLLWTEGGECDLPDWPKDDVDHFASGERQWEGLSFGYAPVLLQSSHPLGNWCPLVYIQSLAIYYLTSSQSTKRHQIHSTRFARLHSSFFCLPHFPVWHPHPWDNVTLGDWTKIWNTTGVTLHMWNINCKV